MSAATDLIALLRQRTEPVGLRELAGEVGLDASPRGLLSLSRDLRARMAAGR